ncbi:MAG: radical SAM protein [Deltaproteobacteria bacterium]|nr:radical SAM protein [Deltaproteobacteria bacterium]MBZ0218961.1 radical SAM protein [Deltaproteobacteria bacterium]
MGFRPGYIRLYETGELFTRIRELKAMLSPCRVCPLECGAARLEGKAGVCRTGSFPRVSAAISHFGEEPPLVGSYGSGTIFLSYCNLKCVFCQNHEISRSGDGREVTPEGLASMMLRLQREGCHNINFVTPTHQAPQIAESLPLAIENGLDVPLVYNSGGYDSLETLKLLEGIFDIYMPDIKYGSDRSGLELSGIHGYFSKAREAVREMHRQVGNLETGPDNIARRGLIVRHLVLPDGLAGTEEVMRFLAEDISTDTYVNIMDQYRPVYRAFEDPRLSRRATVVELEQAIETARKKGLSRIEGRC